MDPESESRTANQTFRNLRNRMKWSRVEVASFLGVSKKAIESYEQGWRKIPDRVWKQMITAAAAQQEYPIRHPDRCWEVTNCPAAIRDSCFCYQNMHGRFCWMTATNCCREAHLGEDTGYLACVDCPITQTFMPPYERTEGPQDQDENP